MRLTDRQLGAVLAGLRLYQQAVSSDDVAAPIDDIATNGGKFAALNADEIDELCEDLQEDG